MGGVGEKLLAHFFILIKAFDLFIDLLIHLFDRGRDLLQFFIVIQIEFDRRILFVPNFLGDPVDRFKQRIGHLRNKNIPKPGGQ